MSVANLAYNYVCPGRYNDNSILLFHFLGRLVAKALKDLNISEGNLVSAASFLHELGEIFTTLRKNITANGKAILSKLQIPLKEMRDEMKAMRENLTITDVLFSKISKPLSEINEDIKTLNKDVTKAQRKDDASLDYIKKEMKEIKQKLNSRATLTESTSFFLVSMSFLFYLFLFLHELIL